MTKSDLSAYVKYINTNNYTGLARKFVRAELYLYNREAKFTNDADTNYKQYYNKDDNNSDLNSLHYLRLADLTSNTARAYFTPPTNSFKLDKEIKVGDVSSKNIRVEAGYIRGKTAMRGKVYSDGKWLYYFTKQNCTALITLYSDFYMCQLMRFFEVANLGGMIYIVNIM